MGLLDGFLGMFRRAPAAGDVAAASAKPAKPAAAPPVAKKSATPAKSPANAAAKTPAAAPAAPIPHSACGPLRLATGDHVKHYRDQFVVVGARYIEGADHRTWHYCLRDAKGAAAVVVAPEGDDAVCSIQRPMKGDVRWDSDVVTDSAVSRPLKVVRRGKAKVRAWDDAGPATAARTVDYREFADAEGERVAALEDYQGVHEARIGDPVFESELTFERAAERGAAGVFTAAAARAGAFEDVATGEIVKGTPRAAARVLEQNVGATMPRAGAKPADFEPIGYEDDSWADTSDAIQTAATPKHKSPPTLQPAGPATSADDDEWSSAARLIRGAPDTTTSDIQRS
jgi:hypothetical protein